VKILKTAPRGRQQLIGIERAGNSLSEVPVFDGGRYPATAQAVIPTVLLATGGRPISRDLPAASGSPR